MTIKNIKTRKNIKKIYAVNFSKKVTKIAIFRFSSWSVISIRIDDFKIKGFCFNPNLSGLSFIQVKISQL